MSMKKLALITGALLLCFAAPGAVQRYVGTFVGDGSGLTGINVVATNMPLGAFTNINVVANGADPTLTSDSSAAVATAMTNALATSRSLYFPPGLYKLNAHLGWPSLNYFWGLADELKITGAGPYPTLLLPNDRTVPTITMREGNGLTIQNLQLRSTNNGVCALWTSTNASAPAAYRVMLRDVTVLGYSNGIVMWSPNAGGLDNVQIGYCANPLYVGGGYPGAAVNVWHAWKCGTQMATNDAWVFDSPGASVQIDQTAIEHNKMAALVFTNSRAYLNCNISLRDDYFEWNLWGVTNADPGTTYADIVFDGVPTTAYWVTITGCRFWRWDNTNLFAIKIVAPGTYRLFNNDGNRKVLVAGNNITLNIDNTMSGWIYTNTGITGLVINNSSLLHTVDPLSNVVPALLAVAPTNSGLLDQIVVSDGAGHSRFATTKLPPGMSVVTNYNSPQSIWWPSNGLTELYGNDFAENTWMSGVGELMTNSQTLWADTLTIGLGGNGSETNVTLSLYQCPTSATNDGFFLFYAHPALFSTNFNIAAYVPNASNNIALPHVPIQPGKLLYVTLLNTNPGAIYMPKWSTAGPGRVPAAYRSDADITDSPTYASLGNYSAGFTLYGSPQQVDASVGQATNALAAQGLALIADGSAGAKSITNTARLGFSGLTVATLPTATASPGDIVQCSDVVTPLGVGGLVYRSCSNTWLTVHGDIIATADEWEYMINCHKAALSETTIRDSAIFCRDLASSPSTMLGGTSGSQSGTGASWQNIASTSSWGTWVVTYAGTVAGGDAWRYGIWRNAMASGDKYSSWTRFAPAVLSSAADNYWTECGIYGSAFGGFQTNCAVFAYDMMTNNAPFAAGVPTGATSAWTNNYLCVSAKAGVFFVRDSGLTVSTSTTTPTGLAVIASTAEIRWATNGGSGWGWACTNTDTTTIPITRLYHWCVTISNVTYSASQARVWESSPQFHVRQGAATQF